MNYAVLRQLVSETGSCISEVIGVFRSVSEAKRFANEQGTIINELGQLPLVTPGLPSDQRMTVQDVLQVLGVAKVQHRVQEIEDGNSVELAGALPESTPRIRLT